MDLSAPDGVPHVMWVGQSPLWYAVFLRSKKAVEWLMEFGNVVIDDVSTGGGRPADLLLYESITKADEALLSDIIEVVKKDQDGGESNAIKEFVRHISDLQNSSKSPIIVSVNDAPAPKEWLQKLMPIAKVNSGVVPAADFSKPYLEISWKKDENGSYDCGFNHKYILSVRWTKRQNV